MTPVRRRLLDPGTLVTAWAGGRHQRGVVRPYEQEYSWGTFPVELADGIWRTRAADDVTVVGFSTSGALTRGAAS